MAASERAHAARGWANTPAGYGQVGDIAVGRRARDVRDLSTMTNQPSSETPPAETSEIEEAPRHVNRVDASAGQPMIARVMERKAELEVLLAGLAENDKGTRHDIEGALAHLVLLTSGDLSNVPKMVVVDMSRWLEGTRHLGERAAPNPAPKLPTDPDNAAG